MNQYNDLVRKILAFGTPHNVGTHKESIRLFGEQIKVDLKYGFPVYTGRKINWKAAVAEMIGFVNAFNRSSQFEELGCNFWKANARSYDKNRGDDLGLIYGVQAREWMKFQGDSYDQLFEAFKLIHSDPDSRRILVTHWRPDEFDIMALPPCHVQYQFLVDKYSKEMHMKMDMRSTDVILGLPNNIVGYAWLLNMVAFIFGYEPRTLTVTMGDCHIYNNQIEGAQQMLQNPLYPQPNLNMVVPVVDVDTPGKKLRWLESLMPNMFDLDNYQHSPFIKFDMVVTN